MLFSVLIKDVSTLKVPGDIFACATCAVGADSLMGSMHACVKEWDATSLNMQEQMIGMILDTHTARWLSHQACCRAIPDQVADLHRSGDPHHVKAIQHLVSDVGRHPHVSCPGPSIEQDVGRLILALKFGIQALSDC